MVLHAPLAHKRLVAIFTLELFGDVMQRAMHLQTVFVSERLPTDLTGVWPDACVAQHVQSQRVELRQGFPTDVTHKLSLGVCHEGFVLTVVSSGLRAEL